jgi:hypothetical protein
MKPARESAESGVDNIPTELVRLLGEAIRCLGNTNLPGANAALKKPSPGRHPSGAAPPKGSPNQVRDLRIGGEVL